MVNNQNINSQHTSDIYLEKKTLKKKHFSAKYDCFFGDISVHFEPLLGWECAYICPDLKTEKEGI